MSKNEKSWADMADEDDAALSIPVTISKHGVKVKKPLEVKKKPPSKNTDERDVRVVL